MIALRQSLKAVIHVAGFSAMSQNCISKRGRCSVMHQPIAEADAPQGRRPYFVWGSLEIVERNRRYINAYSANARPIQWKYSDPTRRVRGNELTATGH